LRFKYTDEHLEFLREAYKEMRILELTEAFNTKFSLAKSRTAIKSVLTKHGYTCGRSGGNPKGCYRLFTQEQAEFIKEQYKYFSRNELTAEFNRVFNTEMMVSQIVYFTRNHSIKSGRTGCFEKGQVSWNKGVKGYMGPNRTSFKKGQVPPNRVPVGTERITVDGYIEIKINEQNPHVPSQKTRFKLKHIVVWEKENGPLPKSHIITFIDGDKKNCSPDNLVLISRSVHAYLNRWGYADVTGEAKLSAIMMAKVIQKTSSLKKKAKAA